MWLLPAGVVITLILLSIPHTSSTPTKNFSYSKFVSEVEAGDVHTASVNPSGAITGTLKGGDDYTSQIPTAITDTQLAPTLKAHDVDVTGVGAGSDILGDLLAFVPLLLFIAFFIWMGRRSARQLAGGIMGIGGSRAKVYDEDRPTTRFSAVRSSRAGRNPRYSEGRGPAEANLSPMTGILCRPVRLGRQV